MIWDKTISYVAGSIVTYNSIQYECLIDNINEIPEGSIKWILLWESDVLYQIGEKVKYQDDEYVLFKSAPVGTIPTITDYWRKSNPIIITGVDGKEYDLENISQNKNRMSSSELILPEAHDTKTKGQIMIKNRDKKIMSNSDIDIDWIDPFSNVKR
jgi:hypothetical protein